MGRIPAPSKLSEECGHARLDHKGHTFTAPSVFHHWHVEGSGGPRVSSRIFCIVCKD